MWFCDGGLMCDPKAKRWGTHTLRHNLVSQVAGDLLFWL